MLPKHAYFCLMHKYFKNQKKLAGIVYNLLISDEAKPVRASLKEHEESGP